MTDLIVAPQATQWQSAGLRQRFLPDHQARLLAPELAAGVARVKNAKPMGVRTGAASSAAGRMKSGR